MYQPDKESADPRYPSFKMPTGQIFPGFGGKQVAVLFGILVAGIAATIALGIPKTDVEVPVSASDRQAAVDRYRYDRNYLYSESVTGPTGKVDIADMAPTEAGGPRYVYADPSISAEVHARAAEAGIEAEMTDDEVDAIVPTETVETRDSISLFARVALLVMVPCLIYIGLTFQFAQGATLRGELWRYWTVRRQVKRLVYTNPYFECGESEETWL